MDTPALLTHVSKPPNASVARSAIMPTSSRLATSAMTVIARPPEPSISTRALASPSGSRAASTTRAPSCAAIFAVASPIPLEAPVMTTTWSSIRLSFTPMRSPTKKKRALEFKNPAASVLDHRPPRVDPLLLAARVLADVRVAHALELGRGPAGGGAIVIPTIEDDLTALVGDDLGRDGRHRRRRQVLRARQVVLPEIHEWQHLEQREGVASIHFLFELVARDDDH